MANEFAASLPHGTIRDQLEAELFALREQRAKLPEATYFARLERLLLPLARIYASAQQTRSTPGNNEETQEPPQQNSKQGQPEPSKGNQRQAGATGE